MSRCYISRAFDEQRNLNSTILVGFTIFIFVFKVDTSELVQPQSIETNQEQEQKQEEGEEEKEEMKDGITTDQLLMKEDPDAAAGMLEIDRDFKEEDELTVKQDYLNFKLIRF